MAIHLACQALVNAGEALVRMGLNEPVWVVVGRTQEDRAEDETEWVSGIRRGQSAATQMASALNEVAAAAAKTLGRSDLAGLSHAERVLMKEIIGGNDNKAQVGRHGVRWTVEPKRID